VEATKARLKEDVEQHAVLFPIRSSWFLNTLYHSHRLAADAIERFVAPDLDDRRPGSM
jgi:hypothetical protein